MIIKIDKGKEQMNKEIQEELNILSLRAPFNLPQKFFKHDEAGDIDKFRMVNMKP